MRSHEITEPTTRNRTSPEAEESVCEGCEALWVSSFIRGK